MTCMQNHGKWPLLSVDNSANSRSMVDYWFWVLLKMSYFAMFRSVFPFSIYASRNHRKSTIFEVCIWPCHRCLDLRCRLHGFLYLGLLMAWPWGGIEWKPRICRWSHERWDNPDELLLRYRGCYSEKIRLLGGRTSQLSVTLPTLKSFLPRCLNVKSCVSFE